MRLVDADKLTISYDGHFVGVVKNDLDNAPTVEAEPVIHGHWEINCDGYYPYCSQCKQEPQSGKMTTFCPNCGAKMDEESEVIYK